MVSELSTSRVIVLPVRVLTKICIVGVCTVEVTNEERKKLRTKTETSPFVYRTIRLATLIKWKIEIGELLLARGESACRTRASM